MEVPYALGGESALKNYLALFNFRKRKGMPLPSPRKIFQYE